MAVKKQTTGRKTAPPQPSGWSRFARSKPGRVLLSGVVFAGLIALFAWLAGDNASLFLLLAGILILLCMAVAWFLYLTLREKEKVVPGAGPKTRSKAR